MSTPDCTPVDQGVKRCTKCGETKVLGEFYPHRRMKDGRLNQCRACMAVNRKHWRQENREHVNAYNLRAYYSRRPEPPTKPVARDGYKYCTQCSLELPQTEFVRRSGTADGLAQRCRECSRKYYRADRERILARGKSRRIANPEQHRAYRERNQERIRDYNRQYMANPEVQAHKRIRDRARTARKKGAAGTCTSGQHAARWNYYGGLCWMCGADATETDHVIALARGGSNWPANLRPACRPCNAGKRDRDWREVCH